nr:Asp23/Gls24 family envelope stress response protein [uncultured Flavonifractor sp.]
MGDGKEYISRPDELGNIHISEDVLAVIAAAAATEVEGVGSLSTNLSSDIAELLGGKKNLSKGIRIAMEEDSVQVDVSLLIKYGYTIVDVAKEVQNAVFLAIENTSGLPVENVNVHVAGILFDKESK